MGLTVISRGLRFICDTTPRYAICLDDQRLDKKTHRYGRYGNSAQTGGCRACYRQKSYEVKRTLQQAFRCQSPPNVLSLTRLNITDRFATRKFRCGLLDVSKMFHF